MHSDFMSIMFFPNNFLGSTAFLFHAAHYDSLLVALQNPFVVVPGRLFHGNHYTSCDSHIESYFETHFLMMNMCGMGKKTGLPARCLFFAVSCH